MIQVNRIGDSITGSYNGVSFGVAYSEDKYAAMLDLAKQAAEIETMDELLPLLGDACRLLPLLELAAR